MRKLFFLALTVVALAAAVPASADPVGGVQPACADIIGDLGAHSVSEDTVFGGIRTLEPTCRGVRYTVVVSYTEGGVQKFAFFSKMGGNDDVVPNEDESGFNGLIRYQITGVHSDTLEVCAAYFSTRGNKILDAVPDSAEFVSPPTPADGCTGWMTFAGSPGGSFPYN